MVHRRKTYSPEGFYLAFIRTAEKKFGRVAHKPLPLNMRHYTKR
jgi:hypothetical protein